MKKINQDKVSERYPGIIPFTKEYRNVFFGRNKDIQDLTELIEEKQVVVLYGKSGLGKSSLINAGVTPILEEKDYLVIPIRFGAYQESNHTLPLDTLKQFVKTTEDTFLDRIIENENSLWYYFKEYSMIREHHKFVIVFDQFEEFFSYPEETVYDFKKQLTDVLYTIVPQKFRKVLQIRMKKNKDLLTPAQIKYLNTPMNIKLVISIREDRYSLLNEITDYIPDIIKNPYQLLPLGKEQAQQAITLPAQQDGQFTSEKFEFTLPAIDKILNYLTQNNTKEIVTAQLQILCNKIEKLNLKEVNVENIPNLQKIFLQFYKETIDNIETTYQAATQEFIENQLIIEDQRVSIDRLICLKYVPEKILQYLVDKQHLLRTVRNSTGRISYEIAHDTLIDPILETKEVRLQEQERSRALEERVRQQEKFEEELKKEKEKRKSQKKALIRTRIILSGVFVVLLLFIGLSYYSYNQYLTAKTAKKKAADIAQEYLYTQGKQDIGSNNKKLLTQSIEKLEEAYELNKEGEKAQEILELKEKIEEKIKNLD